MFNAGMSPVQSKGLGGDKVSAAGIGAKDQKLFNNTLKDTNSTIQDQIANMQQLTGIMGGFGEAAAIAFGEQSTAAKAFAVGQVIANTAQAIMGTWAGYAEFGPAGTALAIGQTAMLTGLAAAQIGKISGAFASGGIVGGSAMSGDRMLARVNSGEMILNSFQQRQLFDAVNGGGSNRIEVVGVISGNNIRLANKRSQYIAGRRG